MAHIEAQLACRGSSDLKLRYGPQGLYVSKKPQSTCEISPQAARREEAIARLRQFDDAKLRTLLGTSYRRIVNVEIYDPTVASPFPAEQGPALGTSQPPQQLHFAPKSHQDSSLVRSNPAVPAPAQGPNHAQPASASRSRLVAEPGSLKIKQWAPRATSRHPSSARRGQGSAQHPMPKDVGVHQPNPPPRSRFLTPMSPNLMKARHHRPSGTTAQGENHPQGVKRKAEPEIVDLTDL